MAEGRGWLHIANGTLKGEKKQITEALLFQPGWKKKSMGASEITWAVMR